MRGECLPLIEMMRETRIIGRTKNQREQDMKTSTRIIHKIPVLYKCQEKVAIQIHKEICSYSGITYIALIWNFSLRK